MIVADSESGRITKHSLLAPLPVAGPQFRFYLTNSPRLYVEGNVYGMYFFGCGNFVSTADDIGALSPSTECGRGIQSGLAPYGQQQ